MSLPSLPVFYDMYYTRENGRMTPDAYLYNDQMFQTLNLAIILLNTIASSTIVGTGASSSIQIDSINAPGKTTAQITALEPDAPNGALWFNTDLAKLQVKTAAGTIETITSV